MILVLDTSAAVTVVTNGNKAKSFISWIAEANNVIAPDLYTSEITNVFWKYVQFQKLSKTEAEVYLERALLLPDEIIPTQAMTQEVLAMACISQHSAYDIFFIITARRNNAKLLTLDRKLTKLASRFDVECL